jgi:hypothetical protein
MENRRNEVSSRNKVFALIDKHQDRTAESRDPRIQMSRFESHLSR